MISKPPGVSLYRSLTAAILLVALTTAALGQAVAPQTASTLSAIEKKVSASVKVGTVRDVTTALADKSMEGRGTGQAGGVKAAKYIADRFSRIGLKPLGKAGTFLQEVKFRSAEVRPESSVKIGEVALKYGTDFVPAPPFTSDKATANGDVIFIGYGVTSESLKRDDLSGVDVKGKIVLLIGGRPGNVDQAAWQREVTQQTIVRSLIGRGVSGVLIANAGTAQTPFTQIADYLTRRRVASTETPEIPFKLPPIVLLSDDAAEKTFAGSGMSYAETLANAETGEIVSRDLKKTIMIDVVVNRGQVSGHNVCAVLEGSDAKLKDQAIVYVAHYNAFGIDSSGRIFPGAADNALGVGELTAMAEAFVKSKAAPRRSIIFLAVTGEEYGLLGAEHWVRNPGWPIDKTAAVFSFDGIGTEVYAPVKRIVGFGAEYSDLGTVMEGVLSATGMILTPDLFPEETVFYRSDHYAFVKKGVPALMLLGGPEGETSKWIARAKEWMKTDYHQTGDVVRPDWVWDGARTVAVTGLLIGLRVANSDSSPQWLPSSPFKRARGTGEPPPSEKN
jgi:hypothetical protein